jgi:hypothetical protein
MPSVLFGKFSYDFVARIQAIFFGKENQGSLSGRDFCDVYPLLPL